MTKERKMRVAFIGSGRVATELALIFRFKGIDITGISSRNKTSGSKLASHLDCPFIEDPNELDAELLFIATNDASVRTLCASLSEDKFIAYTAGAVDLADLNRAHSGVFYPLQTFTENRHLTVDEIPILLESNSEGMRKKMEKLCSITGLTFEYCSSIERQKYHLAAVFVNNFVNHLIHKAQEQMLQNGLNWELLKPLLEETIAKLGDFSAFDAQTGPAKRNDQSTLSTHQALLKGEELNIYEVLYRSIQNTHNENE
jgi:predicted short-subunit dehydrogenase-like oxidoreductase (DUF2520 family)